MYFCFLYEFGEKQEGAASTIEMVFSGFIFIKLKWVVKVAIRRKKYKEHRPR